MKRVAAVCLVLTLALFLISPGYAFWSEALKLNLSVGSGDVLVGMRSLGTKSASCLGNDNPEAFISCREDHDTGELDGVAYSGHIDVDICGYEDYSPMCTIEIANCGSIPVKLDRLGIDWSGNLNTGIKKWAIDYRGGYLDEGNGYRSLNKALEGLLLEPEEKIWLDLEFKVNGVKDEKETACGAISLLLAAARINIAEAAETAGGAAEESMSEPTVSGGEEVIDRSDLPADPVPETEVEDSSSASGSLPIDSDEPVEPLGDIKPILDSDLDGEQPVPPAGLPAESDSASATDTAVSLPSNSETSWPSIDPSESVISEQGLEVPIGEPEVKCGFARGTITIHYHQWNIF